MSHTAILPVHTDKHNCSDVELVQPRIVMKRVELPSEMNLALNWVSMANEDVPKDIQNNGTILIDYRQPHSRTTVSCVLGFHFIW